MWLAILGGLEYLIGYFAVNELSMGRKAATLSTPLDTAIPLVAGWVFIYSVAVPMCFTPAIFVRRIGQVRTAFVGFTVAMTLAVAVFLAYPVEMLRPPVPWGQTGDWLLDFTYKLDRPYNCFPSLHVGLDVYAALCCWAVNRVAGGAIWVMAGLISLSTLFVKQHYLADVAGGFLLAWVSYRAANSSAALRLASAERLGGGGESRE